MSALELERELGGGQSRSSTRGENLKNGKRKNDDKSGKPKPIGKGKRRKILEKGPNSPIFTQLLGVGSPDCAPSVMLVMEQTRCSYLKIVIKEKRGKKSSK
jgi:hypothetical protein